MKIKLKKFNILKPPITVQAGFRTISRGGPSDRYNNYAINARVINNSAGNFIIGDAEVIPEV